MRYFLSYVILQTSTMVRIILGTNLLLERTSVESASEYKVDLRVYHCVCSVIDFYLRNIRTGTRTW